MGTTTGALFNGTSRYSSDFQAVITRATAIASLPIRQLDNHKKELDDQTAAVTALDGKFGALQTAVDGIGRALGGASFAATVSDPAKVSVTLGDSAMEGNYSVEVLTAGAYATSMTATAWVAAPGNPHAYKLSIGGQQQSIFAADNSPGSVASAINSQFGDKVRATVVNVGSIAVPDLRISLQATTLGDLQPDLVDGGASLQTQQTVGAQAHYVVNGSGVDVTSSTRSITIASGLTINLLAAAPGVPVNITVTRSTSALSSALEAFAAAYNATVDEVDKQHGTTSSPLAGQSVVSGLSGVLSRISTYTGSGGLANGLGGLGLELDKTGHLSFNQFTLLASDLTNSSGVSAFLGTANGGGFLKSVTQSLNSVEQTGTGLLAATQVNLKDQIARVTSNIAGQQAVVDRMTVQMQQRLAAMDALIATLEQQYSYLSSMFASQQAANRQY